MRDELLISVCFIPASFSNCSTAPAGTCVVVDRSDANCFFFHGGICGCFSSSYGLNPCPKTTGLTCVDFTGGGYSDPSDCLGCFPPTAQ
jgi:hypothetical protein